MNLLLRLLWIVFFSRFRSSCDITGPCLTPFRCMPTDLDTLLHMNNGKYFSLLDLGRLDLMLRSKLYRILKNKAYYPVIAAETIRFRKSLKVFDRFVIETIVLGWDEKAFILQQRFLKAGESVAEAVVRARFLKKSGGTVTPQEILQLADTHELSPVLPEWVRLWNEEQSKPPMLTESKYTGISESLL